ncbi:glycosyltransferase [Candidatus Falkowbacteria bacterium]|nr:glycosyltransferase [Candidatus Falkowbacteria bacterium]
MKVDFCLPIYNEEQMLRENALRLLNYCRQANFGFDWQIVLVVNGSIDRSFAIAQELVSENPGEFAAIESAQPGRGRALKNYWLQSDADILAYMDLDLAVSLDDIPALVGPIIANECDLVVGSRLLVGSKIERSFVREFTSQSCHLLSRLILGHKFSDLQCGFKAIRRSSFLLIAPKVIDAGWFFDTELAVFAGLAGLRVRELPVDWSEERYDRRKSKVRVFRDATRFMRNFLKLRRRLDSGK